MRIKAAYIFGVLFCLGIFGLIALRVSSFQAPAPHRTPAVVVTESLENIKLVAKVLVAIRDV